MDLTDLKNTAFDLGFSYGFVVDEADVLEEFGDRKRLDSDYMVANFLDEPDPVRLLRDHLAGITEKLLPRIIQQGRVCGLLHVVRPGVIVGVFGHNESDVHAKYRWSKEVAAAIEQSLADRSSPV